MLTRVMCACSQPENILLSDKTANAQILIADFGYTRHCRNLQPLCIVQEAYVRHL